MAKSNGNGKEAAAGGDERNATRRLVTVLYSRDRDLYRLPGVALSRPCWLTVRAWRYPVTQLAADAIYLGPALSPDGMHWRMAYAVSWPSIVPGESVTLPADDPLVRDYEALAAGGER